MHIWLFILNMIGILNRRRVSSPIDSWISDTFSPPLASEHPSSRDGKAISKFRERTVRRNFDSILFSFTNNDHFSSSCDYHRVIIIIIIIEFLIRSLEERLWTLELFTEQNGGRKNNKEEMVLDPWWDLNYWLDR